MNVWKIYSREAATTKTHQEFARECYQAGVIAVGWNQIGDLNAIPTRDRLHELLTAKCGHWADYNANAISQWTGSLWSFRTEVQPGDYVVCPDGESDQYYVGRIQSARVYRDKRPLGGTCPFANRRKVKWLRILNRAQIEKIWPSGQFGRPANGLEHPATHGPAPKALEQTATLVCPAPLPSDPARHGMG